MTLSLHRFRCLLSHSFFHFPALCSPYLDLLLKLFKWGGGLLLGKLRCTVWNMSFYLFLILKLLRFEGDELVLWQNSYLKWNMVRSESKKNFVCDA